jgi:Caudovirus prohead serine protease
VGSVTDAPEDERGVRIKAAFASTPKAQDLRTLVLEGHVDGLSITYEALQHYPGERDGRRVRFLKEIRIHEFSLTPFAMNPSARVLAAKAGPGSVDEYADIDRQLRELESWSRRVTLEVALSDVISNPDSHALAVLRESKSRQQLRELEAWAASVPPRQPEDPSRRPDRTSRAELAHRDALALAKCAPQTRCGCA